MTTPAALTSAATTACTTATATTADGLWTVDPAATSAEFRARDVLHRTVIGTLPVVAGRVRVADGTPVEVSAELDLDGVATGIGKRDSDLRGKHFFDVATSPVLRFAAGAAVRADRGWRLDGTLTLKGVACPVEVDVALLPADDPTDDAGAVRVRATTRLDRRDAGIRVPRLLVGTAVEVAVEALLVPPASGR